MKKLALAMAGSVLGVMNAMAADLDVHPYAAPMIRPAYDWSGFYFGLNGGYGASRPCWNLQSTSLTAAVVGPDSCSGANSAVAGGQFGFRSQINSLVYGFEAQGDWSGMKGSAPSSATSAVAGGLTNSSQIDAFVLVTAQVGFALGDALIYAKGGAAGTSARYKEIQTATGVTAAGISSDSRFGGDAGVGIEYGFMPGWSVGVVYDHLFMGTRNDGLNATGFVAGVGPASAVVTNERIRQDVDMVTARINYVFGGPSISKY